MSYSHDLEDAADFLKKNDRFLVINHVNPDGDATGSLLAMGHILKALGKQFVLANEGHTPNKFSFLPLSEQIVNLDQHPLEQTYSSVIVLDCGDAERMGKVREYITSGALLLNIDHHPTNDGFGTTNLIRTEACATAEILFDLVQCLDIQPDQAMAACLYTGLLTDTGGFRYANTNAEVLEKAGQLLQTGVSPSDVAEKCMESITVSYIKLLQQVLPTLRLDYAGQVASLTVSLESIERSQVNADETDGLIGFARNIEGVEVGLLYKQVDETTVKVSLRSKSTIDVARIAKELGGGGHVRASGCTIVGGLATAQQLVMEKLQQYWGPNE
jgi:phosphoesterase RecJ-like protein